MKVAIVSARLVSDNHTGIAKMTQDGLKKLAQDLFRAAVKAADPAAAVQRALVAKPIDANTNGRMILIAFGKAACAMMEQALREVPQGQSIEAIAVTNYENARDVSGCRVFASGHPLPDQNGIEAGQAVMSLLRSATANDRVLCLISGGGSALLPTPRDGLSLADKITVNETLLSGGLDIVQMNRVRQQLSVLKGGGVLDIAHPAPVRSLIISDVVGDDLEIIASGPTAAAKPCASSITLLKEKNLWDKLPTAARTLLETPKPPSDRVVDNELICSNLHSLEAIAHAALEWSPVIIREPLVGDVETAAKRIFSHVSETSARQSQMIIWGGETTVKINGTGRGGRNQELAVRFASLAQDLPGNWVFMSAGTDGRDGPTDAAGGIVGPDTIAKAESGNVNVTTALTNNDSYRILEAADDLFKTSATGTNVADVQVFIRLAR